MSSREKILNAVKSNKPSFIELKEWKEPEYTLANSLVEDFENLLKSIHTTVKHLSSKQSFAEEINQLKQQYGFVIDTLFLSEEEKQKVHQIKATEAETLDVAVIEGLYGVAENGAIWLTDEKMVNRILPFICKHLVLVIDAKNIVANMHEAYRKININDSGYGVFISGPSKTADIEQSLVIGAHGPLTLTVFII